MDFESIKWDVETEAENLHESLFGTLNVQSSVRKRKKQKEAADETNPKSLKRIKHNSQDRDLTVTDNLNHERLKQKQKKSHSKKSRVSVADTGNISNKRNEKYVQDSANKKALAKDQGHVKESENDDKIASEQDTEEKARKKRKRKCKRNKFKDYSNSESVGQSGIIAGESDTLMSVAGLKVKVTVTDAKKKRFEESEDAASKINSKFQTADVNRSNKQINGDLKSKKSKKQLKRLKLDQQNSSVTEKLTKHKKNAVEDSEVVTSDKKSPFKKKRNSLDPQKLQEMLNRQITPKIKVPSSESVNKEKRVSVPETLLEKSRKKLNAARFRYINEQMYTRSGSDAFEMFHEDVDAFHVYHDGFQAQVEKWPVNPIDKIIEFVKSKPKQFIVADFGCGDAKLAQTVANKVHSFDLVSLNHHVTVCDMAKVPLKDSTVDIAVFCLSLMGTNLSSYLREANRVLKPKGILKIAEVSSRFKSIGKFVLQVESMGFKTTNQDSGNKMFVMLDFRKTSSVKTSTPEISLDPCVYKKR